MTLLLDCGNALGSLKNTKLLRLRYEVQPYWNVARTGFY
jgi:hypothetical protein